MTKLVCEKRYRWNPRNILSRPHGCRSATRAHSWIPYL